MLDTFKARLKAKSKAAGANLSEKRIDAIADRLHGKYPELTEETDHDDKIDSLYDAQDYKDFASVDDYQRAKDAKAKKDKEAAKAKSGSDSDDQPKSEIDELKELIKGLATTVQTLSADKQKQSMQEKLLSNEKIKSIPKQFYKGRPLPEKEEEIESFINEVEADYNEFREAYGGGQQQDNNNGFPLSRPVASAGGRTGEKADPAIAVYANKKAQMNAPKINNK
jgi:hypothetical protein